MGLDCLLRGRRVDLVLSGINHGSNSAVNVLYSGTMGAAIEGSFYGCPSIGLSLDDHSADADFDAAVEYGRRIVGAVLEGQVELPLCLNVNVPKGRPEQVKGIRLCRQNRGFWREEFYRHEDPRAGSTSGSREISSMPNPRPRIRTSGRWRTATSQWSPCRWT